MLPQVCRMNPKNFAFALLKTIQNKLGAIPEVFCDYLTALIGGLEHDLYFSIRVGNVIIPTDELICFRGVG